MAVGRFALKAENSDCWDLERACPGVGREWIRKLLARTGFCAPAPLMVESPRLS
jgi:hypothetical protein